MKKILNIAVPTSAVVAIVFSVAAFTQTNAANPEQSPTPVVTSMPAGQPVDLT